MPIRRELIDELLADFPNLQDILGEGGRLQTTDQLEHHLVCQVW